MRLLQVIPLYDSYATFLRELTAELVRHGHEVLTVCDCEQRLLPDPVDQTFPLRHMAFPRGRNPLKQWMAARRLRRVIHEFQPSIIHAHFSAGILSAALARGISRRESGMRWLGTFHGLQFPLSLGLNRRIVEPVELFSAKQMDQVMVLSQDDEIALRAVSPQIEVSVQKSFGIGCHDRYHDTPCSEEARIALRSKLGIPHEAIVFLFVGRQVDFKGFSIAARAFLEVRQSRSDIFWITVGVRDPLHPCALSQEKWQQLRADAQVRMMGNQSDVLPFYDAADALLFPSTREGMSVCIMEALARRLPVLTNRARGCKELIREGGNGYFFSANSVDAVRDQLLAFSPFRSPAPDPLTRRSAWVAEMVDFYNRFTS